MHTVKRLWLSFMYRWCCVQAYLMQDYDRCASANWLSRASNWAREYQMHGRSLR